VYEIKEQLNTQSSEYNIKSMLNYAKFQLLTQQTKTLIDFDLNNFQENIKSINTELLFVYDYCVDQNCLAFYFMI
jgi:hypothetical protein